VIFVPAASPRTVDAISTSRWWGALVAGCEDVVHGEVDGFPVAGDPCDGLGVGLGGGVGVHQVSQVPRQRLAE